MYFRQMASAAVMLLAKFYTGKITILLLAASARMAKKPSQLQMFNWCHDILLLLDSIYAHFFKFGICSCQSRGIQTRCFIEPHRILMKSR